MISINDVDCEYLWNGNGMEFTEDVKQRWNSMDEQERSKYFTTDADRIHISATRVLDDLFEQLEDNYDIEDLYLGLLNDITYDFVNRFQKILDEISEFNSAEFFRAADEIDPTIDLEDEK
jgi:hypothetical protein|nr:MAG TPA: hypothetical protein [Caudoviricetes sp.]